jgi:two-component system cell cycle sensor histidine kinase/response regulator CckA
MGERQVGRLVLGRAGVDAFPPWDMADATDLANRLAVAVDHASLRRAYESAEVRYRALFEANPQPMWIFDVESLAFLHVNDAAVRQYGYSREDLAQMTVIDLSAPGSADLASAHERVGPSRPGVALTRHQRRDGSVLDVEISSHPLQLGATSARLVMATDVTERIRAMAALGDAAERLRHAHRMDVVGRLADGIAHDFNNLLTAIQGHAELLWRELDAGDSRRRDLDEIRRAADRGAVLARQLLAFADRPVLSPRPVDLNGMVAGLEMLVQRLVGADVRVVNVRAPHLGRVWADPGQLEQVLVALVLAAREAMPHGGELVIETAERRIHDGGRNRVLRPGRYVVLSVSDTGAGLPSAAARDAGAGFSVVYGIVRQLGGVLRVLTDPERGSTVKVYLPVMEEEAASEAEALPASLVGTETVLVVEDEEGVRHVLRRLLARYGYRVLEARHGRDALLEAERWDGPIDLLLTDVVMPEMGGPDLAQQLRARRPGLKVLFVSGYTNEEILRRGLLDPDSVLVPKPFSSDELVQAVRELLDAAPAGAAELS